jgi:trk system potassium uptake protein TrkH
MSSFGNALRFVLFINGLLLLILAAAMIVPMLVDLELQNADWWAFVGSAGVSAFVGASLALSCRGLSDKLNPRAGYLLTASAWVMITGFGCLPLYFSSLHLSFTDAFFETMSGLTTTGSTVLSGLDTMAPGLLLWRSLLQWIGGVGIVVMAIILLPMLRVGGMQLFRTESSDISGKPVARVVQMAAITGVVYVGLSVLCALGFYFAGMNMFDAINHAMATIATGGYSTKDASIGFYNSVPIEIVGIVFMAAGALPLIFYAHLFTKGRRALLQERQVFAFIGVLVVSTLLMTWWNVNHSGMQVWHALRVSAFNVTSVLTDTGFATSDFGAWGSFALGLMFILLLIGGCAGSTAGGIKIFRWQILFDGFSRHFRQMIRPNQIILTRYAGETVDDDMVHGVRNFFVMYLMTLIVLSVVLMATGPDFLSSISMVAQAMANSGLGLGPIGGPSGNFEGLSDPSKWLLIAAMLLGRLELSTVYVLFIAEYWRD